MKKPPAPLHKIIIYKKNLPYHLALSPGDGACGCMAAMIGKYLELGKL
jgi:hypothetical protein